jgi:hypothetical protein
MADTKTPYDISVRRCRYDGTPLDDLDAAGVVVADRSVTVVAVYAAEEEGNHPGEPVPAILANVYVWEGVAVAGVDAGLTAADARDTLAMRQVLARAQRIADLANDLATGTPPPLDGPLDRVIDEVAADMQRSWGLAHCSEATAPPLDDNLARQLARHALARAGLIRDRDGVDPLG